MKRILLLTLPIIFLANKAMSFVFLAALPALWIAAFGVGGVVMFGSHPHVDSDSIAKEAQLSQYNMGEISEIRYWYPRQKDHHVIKLYATTAGKLRNFRDVLEAGYSRADGSMAILGDVKGLSTILALKDINIQKSDSVKIDDNQSLLDFFGTQEAPNYENLALTANRVLYVCNSKKYKDLCDAMMSSEQQ